MNRNLRREKLERAQGHEETDGPHPCSIEVARTLQRPACVPSVSGPHCKLSLENRAVRLLSKHRAAGSLRPRGSQKQAGSFPLRCRPAPPALPPDPSGPHSQPGPRTQSRRWLTPSRGTLGAPRTSNSKGQPKQGPSQLLRPRSCPRPRRPQQGACKSRWRGSMGLASSGHPSCCPGKFTA